MHVLVAVHALNGVGGTETYVQVVAENLVRLGHRVTVYTPIVGPMADVVRSTGATVVLEDGLPESCDALLVNEVSLSYELAERYPGQAQVFVCHSPLFDSHIPPLLPPAGSVCVVMNQRLAHRVAAMAGISGDPAAMEIVHLTQPIDTTRLAPRGEARAHPRRALLLGNYLAGPALAAIEEAWGGAGIELVRVGALTSPTYDVASAVADVDIVVGKARAVLDAMACGRPAFVYDVFGGDGWVTPTTYPRMEANGFAGYAEDGVLDVESLRATLEEYDPRMGHANRELVLKHHQDRVHVEALVGLLTRTSAQDPDPVTPSGEMARLSLLRWKAEQESARLRAEVAALTTTARRLEDELTVAKRRARRRGRAAREAKAEVERLKGGPR